MDPGSHLGFGAQQRVRNRVVRTGQPALLTVDVAESRVYIVHMRIIRSRRILFPYYGRLQDVLCFFVPLPLGKK